MERSHYVWIIAGLAPLALLVSENASPAQDASGGDALEVAAQAVAVLERHCARCHGGPGSASGGDEGGFDHVLDARELAEGGQIVPFDPDASALIRRIQAGEMPPSTVRARPTPAELEVLRQWVALGAPAPVDREARPRRYVNQLAIEQAIARDLRAHSPTRALDLRYVTLTHLHNAGASDEELERSRAGLTKLLSSLTWSESVIVPPAVDPERTVFRVDLRALGWSRHQWDAIARRDPYALARITAEARAIRRATATLVATVRADWLIASASRPPLYHDILGVPRDVRELERRLAIDVDRDVRAREVIRAGFNGSGVSQHNRVIERHALPGGGYYWQSYDFATSTGIRNIFEFPLTFRHDGGEIIFGLPNGFQGYMLVDAEGRRLDRAPTQIVVDRARADSAVVNGLSCMGCHGRGIIAKQDEIRAHVGDNRRAFTRRGHGTVDDVLRLYPPADTLDATFVADRARFGQALERAGIAAEPEPIDATTRLFEAELGVRRAAAELGLTEDAFHRRLARHPDLRRTLGSLLVAGGTAKREVFAALFAETARTLGAGLPIATLGGLEKLDLSCDIGSADACLNAGLAYYRGATSRDHGRAFALFTAACDLGSAEGCRQLGHLHFRGHGVRRDAADAARAYYRACAMDGGLGSAHACGHLAFMHSRGQGVLRDPGRAAVYYDRACRLGNPTSCLALARHYYRGAGVAKNRRTAAVYFQAACDASVAVACRELGHQYRWGVGVDVDWLRSYQLFRAGCDLGDRDACTEILDLRGLLEFP